MTLQAESVATWCRCCGTLHDESAKCPGELRATGPERYGWRVLAESPQGPQVFGTLIAPSGKVWRARILTYPNVLWVAPQGVTIKFVGQSPTEAEGKAVEFIKRHCQRRGLKMGTAVSDVRGGPVEGERDDATADVRDPCAPQRQVHRMRVRYGLGRPVRDAVTDDISETGLFVRTTDKFEEGTLIRLYVEIDGYGIPLRGIVRWTRGNEPGDNRPAGIGLKLVAPHPRYVQYCRERLEAQEAEGASTTKID